MEEYFFKYTQTNLLESSIQKYDKHNRLYIPALWTNFQIESWFHNRKDFMQSILNKYIEANPNEKGYFTIVQHDDGPMLKLPENTIVYGACSGNIPLPLIYEDRNNTLISKQRKSYSEKHIFCSFVGTRTHNMRLQIVNVLSSHSNFIFKIKNEWSPVVGTNDQNNFIETTLNSKFALAPRGYGRSSFRFFEIFQLGTIPIYVWDDIEWLPYKDIIDYSKICVSIHINDIHKLPDILSNINEDTYNNMLENYEKIKDMFGLDFMCKYITK